eukprot:CAMPEP_0206139532 /NCGR_PEP_ID=MMETSP1473-20131121/6270_1 /ASSEMBLY_ACC=CAM_ASM_001109 /TAXON_ID=1461547 /ORGANISM="Stichococcus sp, Strain RCC1054" /LENGTH=478 /DNA_ID=CAMNT_0053533357 /DNA_START=149 /DNA_END=1585 /DNA_ORIENTATION=+
MAPPLHCSILDLSKPITRNQAPVSRNPAKAALNPCKPRLRGLAPTPRASQTFAAASGGSLEASFESGIGIVTRSDPSPLSGIGASDSSDHTATLPGAPETAPSRLLPDAGESAASTGFSGGGLEAVSAFLRDELPRTWSDGTITKARYSRNLWFQDPVVRLKGRDGYAANVRLMRMLFNISFTVHKTQPREPDAVDLWWTMVLKPRFLLWRPQLTLTGRSHYGVNAQGVIISHLDTWDALADNSFLSLEALALCIRSFLNPQQTPDLEGPRYTVLRDTGDYQVRRYEPYLVAEVEMPKGKGPAAGDGFNELAGYIFGGNRQSSKMEMTSPVYTSGSSSSGSSGSGGGGNGHGGSTKMEMTSPVFTTAGGGSGGSGEAPRMAFPIEARYGSDPDALPTPNDARVTRRREEAKVVAAIQFSGLPLDWEVTRAERRLRGALLLDGLKPAEDWALARYNDPFTLPALRRNEVLIKLPDDYEL